MSSPTTPIAAQAAPSKEASERVKVATATASSPAPVPDSVKATINSMTQEELEQEINRILGIKKREEKEAAKATATARSGEPNWATLTEKEALDLRVSNIPIFEHEVPSYMDIKLLDPEYAVVWANRDQRRLGQLLAEGYEFLKREHVAPNFALPLKFDSEGLYIYVDVIAMRVHKRILFGKRRKTVEQSFYQLKRQEDVAKSKLANIVSKDPHLEEAFETGSMEYYTT